MTRGTRRRWVAAAAALLAILICSGCALQVDLSVLPNPATVGQATRFTGTVTDVSSCSVDDVQYCLIPFAEFSAGLRAKVAEIPATASPQFAPPDSGIATALPADAFLTQAMRFDGGTLPASCSEQSIGGASGICCTLGHLTSGQKVTIVLVVTPTGTGSFDAMASASGKAGADCVNPGATAQGAATLRTTVIPSAAAPALSRIAGGALGALLMLAGLVLVRSRRRSASSAAVQRPLTPGAWG